MSTKASKNIAAGTRDGRDKLSCGMIYQRSATSSAPHDLNLALESIDVSTFYMPEVAGKHCAH